MTSINLQNKTKEEISQYLINKVFLVYDKQEWDILLLSLRPYVSTLYITGHIVFEGPTYIRIFYSEYQNCLQFGWNPMSENYERFLENYTKITDIQYWIKHL